MKKISLIVILCLTLAGPAFAQSGMEAMRALTVNSMVEYGQKLFDRGDYNEASAVFMRVLTFDSSQPQALQYLRKISYLSLPAPKAMDIKTVDVTDTKNMKAAIEVKKQRIKDLQAQIMQMRAQMGPQSAI